MGTIHLIIRTIMTVTGIAIISGCGASYKNSTVRPSVSPAAIVQINQRLEIPTRKTRVYIQDGTQTTLRDIDEWSTYCSLRMKKRSAAGEPKQSVSPGRFEIIKVIESEDRTGSQRTYVASLGWFFDVNDHRSVQVFFGVEMRLQSAEQPGVRSLICEKRIDNYGLYNYPTLAEIRAALGNIIEINAL